MKLVFITDDPEVRSAAETAFPHGEELFITADWEAGLDACADAVMIFVDLVATLDEPHRVAGYERFAHSKMAHPIAAQTPLVLLAPPLDYDMDFIAGWPDFVFAQFRKPVHEKLFRRVVTYL